MGMTRQRLQMKGNLYQEGNWWRLRWWEDVLDAAGKLTRARKSSIIGPAKGPEKLSKKDAQAMAWTNVLSQVNARAMTPSSMMDLRQFYTQRFEPEVVWAMKHSGKKHYEYCAKKVLSVLGDCKLRDLDITVLQAYLRKQMDAKYSIQTVVHLKNFVSAVISHAKKVGFYTGENPAALVRLPEMTRKKKPALSAEQGRRALELLDEPLRTAALMSMTTSLNNSEIMGLTWKYVNLGARPRMAGDQTIPAQSFGVFENMYDYHRGSVKTSNRTRIQPIPRALLGPLQELYTAGPWSGPDDPVFASSVGTPIDIHNANARVLKKVGAAIGVPSLSWQSFRRTAATLTGLTSMPKADRIALMGHGSGQMTDYYSDGDIERRRGYLDQVADELVPVGFVKKTVERVKEIDELNKIWEKE